MMKKFLILTGVFMALTATIGINATTVPTDMYVEPGTTSCLVSWNDDENSAWNLRYRLYMEEPEVALLHSLTATAYSSSSYSAITLPAPWGGTNVRAGNNEIYFRNNYNNDGSYGNITYTIPQGYSNMTFTLMVVTYSANSNGAGNLTVSTPQTAAVTHYFSAGDTYYWVVTASSGEKITITTPDAQYSPSIALMGVYTGDATARGTRAQAWTYVNNLNKTEYTIEGLEMGTEYEVQVQAIGNNGSLSDWCRPDVFMTLDEEPYVPSVHILGDIDDQYWSPDAGTKMAYDPETETYTATIHVEENRSFGFSTELDQDDLGGWNYLLPYRFAPVMDGRYLELTDEYLGQALPLSFDNDGEIRVLKTADYEVTVSLEEQYIIIGKVPGSEPLLIGDVNKDGKITITDVTVLINALLNNAQNVETDNYDPAAADVDFDSKISITDVTALVNYLLSNSNN